MPRCHWPTARSSPSMSGVMEGLGSVHVKFTRNTQNILFQFRGDGSTTVRGAVRYAAGSPPLTEDNFQLIVQRTCAASTEQLPHDVRANAKSAIAALLKLELRKHEAAELATTELATTELATAELATAELAWSSLIILAGVEFTLEVLSKSIKLIHAAFAGKAPGSAARVALSLDGDQIQPHVLHGLRRGLELEAMETSIFGTGDEPDVTKVQALLVRVTAGYGMARGAQRRDFSCLWWRPWYLNISAAELKEVDVTMLTSVEGVVSMLKEPAHLNAFLSAVAQSALGRSVADAEQELAKGGAIELSPALSEVLSTATHPPPLILEALKVIIMGGQDSERHCFGALATAAFTMIALQIDESAARSSGLLNSAAAGAYSSTGVQAAPRVRRPDGWANCKAPRRECLKWMPPSYMPACYTVGGDYELGCALGACLQDRWPVLLDEAKALLEHCKQSGEPREMRRPRRQQMSSSEEPCRLPCCALLSTSNMHYSLSMNNYNKDVESALGHSSYAGTHLVDNTKWYDRTVKMAHYPAESVINVFDSVPFTDAEQRRGEGAPKDDGKAVCKHFGLTEEAMLDKLKPANLLVARSLPPDANVAKVLDGKVWALASGEAFSSPLRLAAAMAQVEGSTSLSSPDLAGMDRKAVAKAKKEMEAAKAKASASALVAATRCGPIYVSGVGFVETGYGASGKLTYNNVGTINVLEINYGAHASGRQVLSEQITHHAGGGRQAQANSVRAPACVEKVPLMDRCNPWKAASLKRSVSTHTFSQLRAGVSEAVRSSDRAQAMTEQARARLLLGNALGGKGTPRRGALLLRDSFLRESDKVTCDEIARRAGIDPKELYTLVPDFYLLDPDHTYFEHYKYPSDHCMHSRRMEGTGMKRAAKSSQRKANKASKGGSSSRSSDLEDGSGRALRQRIAEPAPPPLAEIVATSRKPDLEICAACHETAGDVRGNGGRMLFCRCPKEKRQKVCSVCRYCDRCEPQE